MTMTDTEAKALAIRASYGLTPYESGALHDYIEATEARHAAELRELKERFSEVAARVKRFIEGAKISDLAYDCPDGATPSFLVDALAPFILTAPDPLVEEEDPIDALVDLLAPVLTHSQGMAARERESRFRNAIAALKARGV